MTSHAGLATAKNGHATSEDTILAVSAQLDGKQALSVPLILFASPPAAGPPCIVEIGDYKTGKPVFRQTGCVFPEGVSETARKVIASKYFYGDVDVYEASDGEFGPADGGREHSFYQLAERVSGAIADAGALQGLLIEGQRRSFGATIAQLALEQKMAFNSPVWFNVGLAEAYGLKGSVGNYVYCAETGQVLPCTDTYASPQGSACFIQSVQDDLQDIMRLAAAEAMLFKHGSGTGSDLSTLRSTREKLTGGGRPSGPVSFFKVYDAGAGAIKSGGKCMAPYQPVFTAGGVKPAQALAEAGNDFTVLSYSNRLGRVAAKTARAWKSGEKPVVAVVTDKGEFHVSADHPFLLKTGEVVRAIDLKAGLRLFAVSTSRHSAGYVQVGLQDGRKGKGLLHRMVADARLRKLVDSDVVHHGARGILDSEPDNLTVLTSQAAHAALHGQEQVAKGEHVFQRERFPKAGEANGMHASSDFWRSDKADQYREMQGTLLKESGRAVDMQQAARRVAMLNLGYKLVNAGHDIATFEGYMAARAAIGQRVGVTKAKQQEFFRKHFGGYAGFYEELGKGNHRVVEVRPVGTMAVYSIEVDDAEPDDKRAWSEHNYVIAPLGTTEPFMSGVAVLNTRRAARMNTLKVHHPDIHEFINCKMIEEEKARALVAAGYDAHMDGGAYSTVAFQNTNTAIRVTDAFMRLSEVGGLFQTKAVSRTTDAMPAYDAKWLLREAAIANHNCGDPGLQYEDTIQRWHTCPNTAPINSSNPCAEYMFIDESACNLASLNLLRFYDNDTRSFDVAGFVAACEVTITAQEIMVDHASYPTAAIAQNSHDFRPLGLGYANLGAWLMVMGLPYDSDAGRDAAALVTALMHCAAYAQSARMAIRSGPFPRYGENREPMMRVVRMHAEHAENLARRLLADRGTSAAMRAIAEEVQHQARAMVLLGEKHGFRNSQVTLLAPTGTIAFMMDCDTTGIEPDLALVKYKSLAGGGFLQVVNGRVRLALENLGYTDHEVEAIIAHVAATGGVEGCAFINPRDLAVFDCANPPQGGTRYIHHSGHIRMMGAVQPFLSGAISKCVVGDTVVATDLGLVRIGSLYAGEAPDTFRELDGIRVPVGDGTMHHAASFYYGGVRPTWKVTLSDGRTLTGTAPHRLRFAGPDGLDWKALPDLEVGDFVGLYVGAECWGPGRLPSVTLSPPYGSQNAFSEPTALSPDLGRFLGMLTADGHVTSSNYSVGFTKDSVEARDEFRRLLLSLFGLVANDVDDARRDGGPDGKTGVTVGSKSLVEWLVGVGWSKDHVPAFILSGPREVALAYLSGLYLDGYITKSDDVAIGQALRSLLTDVQLLWDNLGVATYFTRNEVDGVDYPVLHAFGHCRAEMARIIDWLEPHKKERAALVENGEDRRLFPTRRRELMDAVRASSATHEFRSVFDPRTSNLRRATFLRAADAVGLPVSAEEARLHYVSVVSVEYAGEAEVYDLSVPGPEAFVGNGIVNHNTVNLPATATVDDFVDCYHLGWRLGLKAIAIYRDGSKGGQPLTVGGTNADAKDEEEEEQREFVGPKAMRPEALPRTLPRGVAEKLPDEVSSLRFGVRLDGHKIYLHVGFFPGPGPKRVGELFLKSAKEGSTIAGLLDTIGAAVSLGLQHGVPLETYVAKFVGQRFEPQGFTSDPDVQIAKSIVDWAFRKIAAVVARLNAAEALTPDDMADEELTLPTAVSELPRVMGAATGDCCAKCGSPLRLKTGSSCYTCENCGQSSGACG